MPTATRSGRRFPCPRTHAADRDEAITALLSRRVSYAIAGAGVLAALAVAVAALRFVDWAPELEQGGSRDVRAPKRPTGPSPSRRPLTPRPLNPV